MDDSGSFTAFSGTCCLASGPLTDVLRQTKAWLDGGDGSPVLIFEDQTGNQIDFDFRGSLADVLGRLTTHPHFANAATQAAKRSGPGRPKLGVVCREVSLLPRHWAWLEQQPGGMSVALRKLVELATKSDKGGQHARRAREAAGKFIWAMAGNLTNFEEASRALFAKDQSRFDALSCDWPEDIRKHAQRLTHAAARLERAAEQEREQARSRT